MQALFLHVRTFALADEHTQKKTTKKKKRSLSTTSILNILNGIADKMRSVQLLTFYHKYYFLKSGYQKAEL